MNAKASSMKDEPVLFILTDWPGRSASSFVAFLGSQNDKPHFAILH